MILADSSILVAYLRNAPPEIERILLSGQVALCGVTRAELLHGARCSPVSGFSRPRRNSPWHARWRIKGILDEYQRAIAVLETTFLNL